MRIAGVEMAAPAILIFRLFAQPNGAIAGATKMGSTLRPGSSPAVHCIQITTVIRRGADSRNRHALRPGRPA
jgi:hypothetical protein